MGNFDKQIAWLREHIAHSAEHLVELESGRLKHFDLHEAQKDETAEWIDRLKKEIAMNERYIAAYERKDRELGHS